MLSMTYDQASALGRLVREQDAAFVGVQDLPHALHVVMRDETDRVKSTGTISTDGHVRIYAQEVAA